MKHVPPGGFGDGTVIHPIQYVQKRIMRRVINSIIRGYVSCDVKRMNKATEYELIRLGHSITKHDKGYSISFYT